MYDYLVDHALKNVWCTPDQDNQRIYTPKRLTANGGVKSSFRVMWRLLPLPDKTSHWHIYQIGNIHPVILNLLPNEGAWTTFAKACNDRKLVVDIYNDQGVQMPRFDTFFQFTEDHNLIVAVRKNVNLSLDFDQDAISVRLYSNAFFASARADAINDVIYVKGANVQSVDDILEVQNSFNIYKTKVGATYAFVNGYTVTAINLFTAKIGDTIEFIYDSSIRKIVDFRLGDLQVFNSTLDSTLKYFLHYPGADDGTIDYRDDVDFYLLYPVNNAVSKGLYYHKNLDDSVRMVTHRDYAIPTAYIAGYQDQVALMLAGTAYAPQDLIVRLHIRQSGYKRELVFDANRIKELYKMPEALIPRAMLGLDATVPNWQVANLENSGYTKIMGADCCDVTNAMVNQAYGYNAISKLYADTPQFARLESGVKMVDLPYGLIKDSTVYEYNEDGLMTGWYYHPTGSRYDCVSLATTMVEALTGLGSQTLSDRFSETNINVDTSQSYRVYWNETSTVGVPEDWVDITGTNKYTVVNGLLTRATAIEFGTIMVRTEARFLAYDMELTMAAGELRFGLQQIRPVANEPTSVSMEVPCGQIDVFLNQHSLIRDLDYYIKFPEIVIVNKQYLDDPLVKKQKVHVRMLGYCDASMTIAKAGDAGFIQHGLLSNNNKFDLRDDKVQRIIVDGRLYDRSEMVFSEEHSGVSILNPINGKPYSIQDIVVPLKNYTAEPTFTVRNRALVIDAAVAQYLTVKIPEAIRPAPSAITQRYALFSPFICKIIYDLVSGQLNDARYKTGYSDMVAKAIATPYEHLLEFDPTQQDTAVDDRYVIIHPHNLNTVIDLDLYGYRFVERVIKIYTNNLVTLSGFVTLSTP